MSKLGTIGAEQATLLDVDVLIGVSYAIEKLIPQLSEASKKSWVTP